jgi:hypothetical protein
VKRTVKRIVKKTVKRIVKGIVKRIVKGIVKRIVKRIVKGSEEDREFRGLGRARRDRLGYRFRNAFSSRCPGRPVAS